jgi:streptomycin 6-kinase
MEWLPFDTPETTGHPSRSRWTSGVATLTDTLLLDWALRPVRIVSGGSAAIVLEVEQADGSPAILKASYPHDEASGEAIALGAMGPSLAAAVLRQDVPAWAMLLERVTPGDPLGEAWDLTLAEAATIAGTLHLRVGATPIPSRLAGLDATADRYRRIASVALLDQADALELLGARDLVAGAVAELAGLVADFRGPPVLLHGDYNPGNILRSAGGPGPAQTGGHGSTGDAGWRLIDPKPLVGDPAFDLWQVVAQLGDPLEGPDPAAAFAATLRLVADATGRDARRIARWGFARSGVDVTWAIADGDSLEARDRVAALRAWRTVLDGL